VTAPKRGSGPRPTFRSRAPSPRRSVGRVRVRGPQGGPSRHRSAGWVRILRFTRHLEPPPRRSADRVRDLLTARLTAAPERRGGGEVCGSRARAVAAPKRGSGPEPVAQGSGRRRAEARVGSRSCGAARSPGHAEAGTGSRGLQCSSGPSPRRSGARVRGLPCRRYGLSPRRSVARGRNLRSSSVPSQRRSAARVRGRRCRRPGPATVPKHGLKSRGLRCRRFTPSTAPKRGLRSEAYGADDSSRRCAPERDRRGETRGADASGRVPRRSAVASSKPEVQTLPNRRSPPRRGGQFEARGADTPCRRSPPRRGGQLEARGADTPCRPPRRSAAASSKPAVQTPRSPPHRSAAEPLVCVAPVCRTMTTGLPEASGPKSGGSGAPPSCPRATRPRPTAASGARGAPLQRSCGAGGPVLRPGQPAGRAPGAEASVPLPAWPSCRRAGAVPRARPGPRRSAIRAARSGLPSVHNLSAGPGPETAGGRSHRRTSGLPPAGARVDRMA
jgi:hypothetical protein